MNYLELAGAILAIVFLLSPTLSFLFVGWKERRSEILSGIYSNRQKAIKTYFSQFHPSFDPDEKDQIKRFQKYYATQYGRVRFLLPISMLILIAGFLFLECFLWLQSNGSSVLDPPSRAIGMFAVLGAYMWVLFDQISRWWYADLSPGDLYWASFRFAVAVPIGYAMAGLVTQTIAPTLAFFLGAFPTNSLLALMKRLARQKLDLGEGPENIESQLQNLHGIDSRKAERFAEEGITTVAQLAYYDPIKLTIRTNLGYSYIVDCVGQALLWIYTEGDHDKWRKAGLRSAFEITNLSNALWGDDQEEKQDAESVVKSLASELNLDEMALRNVIQEVAGDPYSDFIYQTWTD